MLGQAHLSVLAKLPAEHVFVLLLGIGAPEELSNTRACRLSQRGLTCRTLCPYGLGVIVPILHPHLSLLDLTSLMNSVVCEVNIRS